MQYELCCTIVNWLVWCRIQTIFAQLETARTVCRVLSTTGVASQTERRVLYHCLHRQWRGSVANQQRRKSDSRRHKCSTSLTTSVGTQRFCIFLHALANLY